MNKAAAAPILVVEDEPKIAQLLVDYLEEASFRAHWLATGETVVAWVQEHAPQLVLLDVMLPDGNGMDICSEIRSFSSVPVIMVTARVHEIDRLLGLELGADDYICKPFSPREVIARIKAILRRVDANKTGTGYVEIELDPDRYDATVGGHSISLTPVEFRLLHVFTAHPGRIFSRAQLMDQIYPDGREISDRAIDSHIKNLRRKIEPYCPSDVAIRSVYGVGYKLE